MIILYNFPCKTAWQAWNKVWVEKPEKNWFFCRLQIKIIYFYSPLLYYCLMTSAGGNVTYLSHGENKLNYHPLNLYIFADFSLENCGFFSIVYLVFQKTIKLCTTPFWENSNLYFTSGTLCKVKILTFPYKVVANNYYLHRKLYGWPALCSTISAWL